MSGLAERLIWALLAEGRGTLRALDQQTAHLQLATGEHVVLVAPTARVEPVLAAHRKDVLHLVTIGGSADDARRVATETYPAYRDRWRVGFHHLGEDGTIAHLAGERSTALESAVLTVEPTEEMLAQLRAARQPLEDQVHLARAFGRRFPWVTLTLAVSCTALFVLSKVFDQGNFTAVVVRMGALTPGVKEGEIWRLFAAAFLHGNVFHLIVNMIALLSFGIALERLLGPSRFVILYALSALGGSLASSLLRPVIGVGASGAIWGLMTAGIALAYRPHDLLPPRAAAEARRTGLAPLVINVLYSFQAGIDLLAHFGGGLIGFVLMFSGAVTRGVTPLWKPGTTPARDPLAVRVGALGLAAAMIASVAAALLIGRPWELAAGPSERVDVRVGGSDLTLRLPKALAERTGETSTGDVRTYTFGSLEDHPVVVEVIVGPPEPGAVLDDASLAELRDGLDKAKLDTPSGPRAVKVTSATERVIGDHRVVEIRHRIGQVNLHTVVTLFAERAYLVRVYTRAEPPAAWRDVGEKIVTSLRFGPPG